MRALATVLSLIFLSVVRGQITINLEDVTVADGEEAIFFCNYSAPTLTSQKPVIRWFGIGEQDDRTQIATYQEGNVESTFTNRDLTGFAILEGGRLKMVPSAEVSNNKRYKYYECEVDFLANGYSNARMTYTVYKFPTSDPTVEVYPQEAGGFEISEYPTVIGNCVTGYGYPAPVVTFLKNGETLEIGNTELGEFSDPSLQSTGDDGIMIATTQEFAKVLEASDDQALFQCRVEVSAGEAHDTKTVTLPSFRVLHHTTTATLKASKEETVLGDEVTLTCEGNGFPEPTITIDGEEVSSVTLTVTKDMHDQTYTCVAKNQLNGVDSDEVTSEYTFTVIYVDEPVVGANQEKNYGDAVELECAGSGFPEPALAWFKADTKVSSTGTYSIESATFDDNGAYECRANNGKVAYTSATTTVVVNGIMLDDPEATTIDAGTDDTVTLECIVTSNPEATITWTASDENIELGNAIEENTDGFTFKSKINVGPITSEFSQVVFTCTATNGEQEVSKEFSLPEISAQGSSIAGVIIGILVAILLVAVILAVLYNKGIICKKGEKGDETAKDITPGDVPKDGNGDVEAGAADGTAEEKETLMNENNGETNNEP